MNLKIPLYLCSECAESLGGTWPEGHRATFHYNVCPVCNVNKALACWNDWDWSDVALMKIAKSTREI